ncbi:MAG: 4Fe-4S binding protein [Paracoccaceae bacterium]
MAKQLILCDCSGSQSLDADALTAATGFACSKVHSGLCTHQIELAATAIQSGDAIIACQQERQRFEDLAAELDAPMPGFVDLRDRAGWSDDEGSKLAKMAALVAEAALPVPQPKVVDVVSEGMCLIIGESGVVIPAAEELRDILSVTVLQTDDAEPPLSRGYDVIRGRLKRASGALGGFEVHIDALQEIVPGGRGGFGFGDARDGAVSQCDIIIDLTGNTALFSAPEKREGYLRAEPRSPAQISVAVLQASQMIGTFEKPLYVKLEPSLCAHSRAGQAACSNCLDICPTGAILSDGDHVAIDPMVCAGCGGCAAVCPSGAISYDAAPAESVFRRIEVLASSYRKAGGEVPRLLVTDADFGIEMVQLLARFGRGLPADVIPLEIEALAGFGHAEILAALAVGFASVDVLVSPKTERDALVREIELAVAIAGESRVRLLEPTEPDQLGEALFEVAALTVEVEPILPMGTRRQVARLAAKALLPEAEFVTLPEASPYGAVVVDTESCSLCLSCVSLCPSGALGDNPDLPQLRFQEDACLQCGLCVNICPEDAITLQPRLNLTDAAFTQSVVHEEDPFACVECGALFGVKSTIEKVVEKLAGKHSMFATTDAARMIQMCDTCRVNAHYHSQDNPMQGGERPRVRTSEDYFSKRKDH